MQAGKDGAQFLGVIFHEAMEIVFFPGKDRADVGSHLLAITTRFQGDVAPGEAGHGVKFDEIEVVLTPAADFGEYFIEGEFLVKEGGAGVEGIRAKVDAGISSTDASFFLQNGDLVTAMRKKHGCGESSGSCSDDNDVLLQKRIIDFCEP